VKIKKGKKKSKKDSKKKSSSKSKKKKKKKSSSKNPKDKKNAKDSKTTVKPGETPKKEDPKEELRLLGPNPYTKGWGRMSAFPMGMIWYGRTLIEREKYEEAEFVFRELEEDRWFPVSLRDELYTAEAHLWIKQKRYDRAIAPLEQAIQGTDSRQTRARLAYILAQICERSGLNDKAYAAFETVLKSRPKYEMDFNARLHQIEAGWSNGSLTSAEADERLQRMIRDEKNRDYLDQVYYVVAEIALKEDKRQEAIAALRKSLAYNKGNAPQRTESYLRLADLYFETENFVFAKNYYDSTLTVLAKTDNRHPRVARYAENLKDIARLIQTIAVNDSIVRVYNMSDAERKDLAKVIKKKRAEEARAQADREAKALADNKAKPAAPAAPIAGQKPSSFYFYNEAFQKKGKKDFARTWGDRKLEDNWRRSKRTTTGGDADVAGGPDSLKSGEDRDLKDVFATLPKSESEIEGIHLSTYEAMYQLGTLYRDKLESNPRCVKTLEDMQARYQDTTKYVKFEKETWYYCYLAHNDLRNADRAQYYYDRLLGKHPKSSFARAISDPNFKSATEQRKAELNKYYEETYTMFQKGNYKDAHARCEDAPKKYGSQNAVMPKFALLGALCIGNLQGNEAYCKALNDVIARFPESAEATRAKEIARLLGCKGFEVGTEKTTTEDAYTLDDDKQHFLFVSVTGKDVQVEDIKNAISDYNREKHKSEGLRLSNIILDTKSDDPILVVRKFDNRKLAMTYLREVTNAPDFLGETTKKTYNKEFFVISQENYRRLLKNKSLTTYRDFFADNYLK
jgi:tetratricopeptide (TPR) repeat protein